MNKLTISLTDDEKDLLIRLLEHELGETRVEAHRTHTPNARDVVMREEQLLRELLQKLRASGS